MANKPKHTPVARGVKTHVVQPSARTAALKALPPDERREVLGEYKADGTYGFKKGNPGGGRPKGSVGGRARALGWLDSILCEHKVKVSVKRALRNYAIKKPIKFYKEIVMPLVPKEVLTKTEGERKLAVRITFGGQNKEKVEGIIDSRPQPAPALPSPSQTVTASDPSKDEHEGIVVAQHLNPAKPGRRDTE